jgi:hypothetical protein
VLGSALQHQTRRVGCHHTLQADTHLLAPTQVGASECVRSFKLRSSSVKRNLSTPLAGARAHIDHTVGGLHHGRVMFHHHQSVARVTQALHGHNNAVHVARVQANTGLVQHKQRVHQRGTQGSGQVNALHFAATQGTALAV